MSTVFSDPVFNQTTLQTLDKRRSIICTLKGDEGRTQLDLTRVDSEGFITGWMIEPASVPDWMVPGTILTGKVQGLPLSLTFQATIQSNIAGLDELLGDKVRFRFSVTTEF